MLGILTPEEHKTIKNLAIEISGIVKEELAKREWNSMTSNSNSASRRRPRIALIDEISGGNMRVYKNGEYIEPLLLAKLMLED